MFSYSTVVLNWSSVCLDTVLHLTKIKQIFKMSTPEGKEIAELSLDILFGALLIFCFVADLVVCLKLKTYANAET